ncbi:desulfoferrodoxin [Methanococcoides orientis]|uniref:desulfoferrodoxin family protein n=1 Tax=Methanococcoides orientis TaxID=2822137 RepID=UPI001E416908|nr:desulfoferrodoxin family protein [Methanococcoides orientis]UGV39873.1 desulfoferrodoxin [Methanococcoides orientis]
MEFADIIRSDDTNNVEDRSKERHIPIIEVLRNYNDTGKEYIRVVVGENAIHPNTPEHHIEYIELYGRTKMMDTVTIGRVTFGPGVKPDAIFGLVNFGKYREFCAIAYCNVHGPWQNCIEIREQLRLTAGCRREKCLQEGFGV